MPRLAPFELHRPTSVSAATDLLNRLGDDGVVYAGGTELLLVLKLGYAAYGHLVDVKRIPELRRIELREDALEIGATVTHREVEQWAALHGWEALAAMEHGVANARVRAAGTLGGNLAFNDPHSDPATFLLAADASVTIGRGDERSSVLLRDFLVGPYQTALQPADVLVSIRIPPMPTGAGVDHRKFSFNERPAVTVSCLIRVTAGHVVEARLAVGSVGVLPVRATVAERLLVGQPIEPLDPAIVEAVGAAAAVAANPVADANGAVDYKSDLVRVIVGRSVRAALDTATRAPSA